MQVETMAPLEKVDWTALSNELDAQGFAIIPGLILPETCRSVASLYGDESLFRSRIVMSRHGYGRGEYKYFAYPLPALVEKLRSQVYPELAPIANRWLEQMNGQTNRQANGQMDATNTFPAELKDFLERCHAAGQNRPTPLLLQYGAGDFNCLHQDLYGEHVFPLQMAILLSQPGEDFQGGEFVMTEQRPRMQSRPMVVPLQQGDAVIFAVHTRPLRGTKGYYRVNMRHGVSRILSGHRHTLGIIFHDAQ